MMAGPLFSPAGWFFWQADFVIPKGFRDTHGLAGYGRLIGEKVETPQ